MYCRGVTNAGELVTADLATGENAAACKMEVNASNEAAASFENIIAYEVVPSLSAFPVGLYLVSTENRETVRFVPQEEGRGEGRRRR